MKPDDSAAAPDLPPAGGSLRIALGGFLMGLANLVPGVSGGTMILAMGLYERFIESVSNVTRFKLSRPTVQFCLLLGAGLVVAILSLSGPFVWLVREHRWVAYSLFVGMTLGGVPALLALARPFKMAEVLCFVVGLGLMLAVAFGLRDTVLSPSIGVLLIVGAAASASMILPGVSGSYILLILGLYDVVWSAVRPEALKSDLRGSLELLIPLGIGVVLGIGLLSNILRVLLARSPRPTHAALLGLLLGSIVGLWPFQDAKHPVLASKPGVEATQMALAEGTEAEILAETGLSLSAGELAQLRVDYAGKSRGDLKKLGLQLERFRPQSTQVLIALALLVAGFILTRKLGVEESEGDRTPVA